MEEELKEIIALLLIVGLVIALIYYLFGSGGGFSNPLFELSNPFIKRWSS